MDQTDYKYISPNCVFSLEMKISSRPMKQQSNSHPQSSSCISQPCTTIYNWTIRNKKRRFILLAFIAVFLVFKLLNRGRPDLSTFDSTTYTGDENVHAPHPDPPLSVKLQKESSNKQIPIVDSGSHLSEPPIFPIRNVSKSTADEEKGVTLAITTTVLKPGPTFPIWLDYHLRRFDLIIIFMDDPAERPSLERIVSGKPVVLFEGSTAAAEMKPATRLVVRQDKNNEVAVAYGLTQNITWLLHIDIDELFYEDGDQDWQNQEKIGQYRFHNHEAVPSPHNLANFFEECTFFWVNGQKRFMAYDNGKAAVRLSPDVVPWGPHNFGHYKGEDISVKRPMILHYSTPSFESWVAKYKHYGDFPDYWEDDYTKNGLEFMLESRDYVKEALATGDWQKAHKFYDSLIPDPETRESLLETGVLRQYRPLVEDKRE